MLNAVQIVLTLLILMAAGYFLSAKGYINDKVARFTSQLVLWVGVPASALDNMLNHFTRDMLLDAGLAIFAPLIGIFVSFLAGMAFCRLFRVKEGRRGIFCNMFAFSNTIFIGLPVSQALFGEAATPYALFYYMGSTFWVWTIGIYALQKDGETEKHKILSFSTLKKLLSPGLVGFGAGLLLVLLKAQLPMFALKACKYLGGISTPLALIYIGYVVYKIGLKNLRLSKDMLGVLIGRLLVNPALVFLMAALLGAPAEMSKVFIVQAAMPAMSNAPVLAAVYHSDSDFSAQTMALTTILSLGTMPLIMLLFQWIF